MNSISIRSYCVCCSTVLVDIVPRIVFLSYFTSWFAVLCFYAFFVALIRLSQSWSVYIFNFSQLRRLQPRQVRFLTLRKDGNSFLTEVNRCFLFWNVSCLPATDQSRTVYIRAVGDRHGATETERADKKTEVKTREKVRRRASEQMELWWNSTYKRRCAFQKAYSIKAPLKCLEMHSIIHCVDVISTETGRDISNSSSPCLKQPIAFRLYHCSTRAVKLNL